MLFEIALSNALVLALIVFYGTKRVSLLRGALVGWTIINTILLYALLAQVGMTSPTFGPFGLKLPWYFVIFVAAAVVLLPVKGGMTRPLRLVVMYILMLGVAYHRGLAGVSILAYKTGAAYEQVFYAFSLIMPFVICVLCTLPWLAGSGELRLRRLFVPTLHNWDTHKRRILVGSAFFFLVFLVSNVVIYGKIALIDFPTDGLPFLTSFVLTLFFWVLLDQVLAIAVARRVVEKVFGDGEPAKYEVFLYAALMASLYSDFSLSFIIREFSYGLIFSYLYFRTGTLFYGIAIRSLAAFFVA